jgi:hypothetical protein
MRLSRSRNVSFPGDAIMKTNRFLLGVLLLSSSFALAEEPQEFPKPGPEHEVLKQLEGTWEGDMKCHFPQAEGAPSTVKAQYTAKMDVGNFFLIGEIKSEFFGQPFQGRVITGYDPFQKKYTGVWVDSMSPALYMTQGEWDKSNKTYNETMEGPGPDGKPMKFRSVSMVKGEDELHFTMYGPGEDGKEALMMEITYKRKK